MRCVLGGGRSAAGGFKRKSASAASLGSPRVADEQVHARLNAAASDDRSPPLRRQVRPAGL